jgi:murein DD-endopeptidase
MTRALMVLTMVWIVAFATQPFGQAPAAPAAHTLKPQTAPIDVVVPIAPTAFQGDGKWHLVYELHVANLGKWDCQLTRIEVSGADSARKSLANFSGAELEGMVTLPGRAEATEKTKIAPGEFAVVYVWVTVDRRDDVPPALEHRISMKVGDYPEGISADLVPTPVKRNPVAVISPPLRGDEWLAGSAPSNTSDHRRALIPINGRAYISQRFAIDWVQLYADGKTYHGDPADNKNYRAYGAEIHAVADGIVIEIKDGIPQNVPGENSRAVPITLETVGGNHVIMDIGGGLYAFYAHLQPGSLRVKTGDKVRRGQILGLLGNTGNSTEPHLHFHICNANSELGSEGLPYAFASYEERGKGWGWKPSSESLAPPQASRQDMPVTHKMEMPLENEIVRFSSP